MNQKEKNEGERKEKRKERREIQREVNNVEARSRWVRGEQVQDVAGSAGGRHGELRRQHRSQEPLYHLRQGEFQKEKKKEKRGKGRNQRIPREK